MTAGSVMSAITCKVPPHNGYLEMSAVREANCLADCLAISHRSSKVLFRRSAQDIPSGLVRVLGSGTDDGFSAVGLTFLLGTMRARYLLLGANAVLAAAAERRQVPAQRACVFPSCRQTACRA